MGFPPNPTITKSQAWCEQRDFFERVQPADGPYREQASKGAANCVGSPSDWKEKKPTKKQLNYLASCGVYWPDKVTRGWASEAIGFIPFSSAALSKLMAEYGHEPALRWQIEWRKSVGLPTNPSITKGQAYCERQDYLKAETERKEAAWSFFVKQEARRIESEIHKNQSRIGEITNLLKKKPSANEKRLVDQEDSLSAALAEIESKLAHEEREEPREALAAEIQRISGLLDRVDQIIEADDLCEELEYEREQLKEEVSEWKEEMKGIDQRRADFWHHVCGKAYDFGMDETAGISPFAAFAAYSRSFYSLKKIPTKVAVKKVLASLDEGDVNWDLRAPAASFSRTLQTLFPECFGEPQTSFTEGAHNPIAVPQSVAVHQPLQPVLSVAIAVPQPMHALLRLLRARAVPEPVTEREPIAGAESIAEPEPIAEPESIAVPLPRTVPHRGAVSQPIAVLQRRAVPKMASRAAKRARNQDAVLVRVILIILVTIVIAYLAYLIVSSR